MLRDHHARRNASGMDKRLARLRLECLEDRAVPATFNVSTTLDELTPGDGRLSLREAVARANNHPGADTIVLPAGVFKLAFNEGDSGGGGEDGKTNDFDMDITDSLAIRGGGAGLTVIDGQQLDRVFDILGASPGSIRVVLQGLVVRNGKVTGDGGGIRVGNADLVVRDCVVSGNRTSASDSSSGGGISNASLPGTGNVTLVRTTVARNVADGYGGGLYVGGGASNLTVRDGRVSGNTAVIVGGGILADDATLTNCTVSGNTAEGGGGIWADDTVTLTNCTIAGNTAGGGGGGIWADGTATLTNCTIAGNTTGWSGGGVNAETVILTHCTVSGNSAGKDGGGIRTEARHSGGGDFPVTLTNCTVTGNHADWSGGGVNATRVTLTNSTVSGNSAGFGGGGIFAYTSTVTNSPMTATNSTVAGNTAGTNGGGVWAIAATLLNCTVARNVAHTGGGFFHAAGGSFSITNTIVALNLVDFGGTGPDVAGDPFNSLGHNLIGNGDGVAGFGVNFDIVGTTLKPVDPKLGPLANNGGRTRTMALLAGSRAIDRGDNSLLRLTDQRGGGFPRVKDGNGDGRAVVDIGAFEK